ncbi:uncharacterized protein LOC111579466 isoform X2 [Amphiprion ocellaris]|uniref:uncharacterized protein LOC111579466 isoform X2 n=1 Tax=Amphiprion ocellaris TaxID=80972 RepID=UPI000C316AE9|nr:uncharacterized protein LOC111579466 isoform X2 [Amphiprion ocellaris]
MGRILHEANCSVLHQLLISGTANTTLSAITSSVAQYTVVCMQQFDVSLDLLAGMDGWRLWFVLLWPLCLCADNRVTVTKTIDRGPDVTPVCIRKSLLLATCKINTGRHQDEDCCQLHTDVQRSECECDSRFRLENKNQKVFLYLSSLWAADSGNYTCECSYERGTHVLHLSITVEDGKDGASSTFKFMAIVVLITLAAATTFISAAGIICGHILRINHHRQNTSGAPEPARCEPLQSLEQDDTYTSLQRPDNDVYQSVSINHLLHNTGFRSACTDTAIVYTNSQAAHGKEHDFNSVYAVYETI